MDWFTLKIDHDVTVITMMPDIAHIINHCIAGYGMFDVSRDLMGEPVKRFIQTHFFWLERHWEIYGDKKPEPDTDNLDDFDKNYWKQIVEEIERKYDIYITP